MEFKNFTPHDIELRIYKIHKMANGFVSVTYAHILGDNAVSTERTVEIEDKGGVLTSLYAEIVGK